MSNEFYAPGAARAAKVGDLFARIARRYDLMNDVQSFGLHRRWKERVANLAEIGPGTPVLDVCCGTGDLAFALATRGAEVIGLDFSEPMLAVARERSDQRPHPAKGSVQFNRGDAQQLPYADGTFDAATVGYGLRNLVDWKLGLKEMARVLRPGGRLLVLDFGKPDFTPWCWAYFGYLRVFVPVMGLLFCGNLAAYAYILESLKHYPAQHGVAAYMRELGLTDVRIINLLGGAMTINCGLKPGKRIN